MRFAGRWGWLVVLPLAVAACGTVTGPATTVAVASEDAAGAEAAGGGADAASTPEAAQTVAERSPCTSTADCRTACEAGDAEACMEAVDWLEQEATDRYQRDLEDERRMREDPHRVIGEGYVERWVDTVEVERLWARACELGSVAGCLFRDQPPPISGSFGQRLADVTPEQLEEHVTWRRRGCDAGLPEFCAELSRRLAELGRDGEVEEPLRRACELDERYCTDLARRLTERGRDGEAEEPLRRACELDAQHCVELAGQRQRAGDFVEAEALYRQACEGEMTRACKNLAIILHRDGRLEEAQAAYRRGCDAGHAAACLGLSVLLRDAGRHSESAQVRSAAVAQLGESPRNVLADLYAGLGRIDEALDQLDGPCEGGDGEACNAAAEILERASRVEEAAPFRQRACRAGSVNASCPASAP